MDYQKYQPQIELIGPDSKVTRLTCRRETGNGSLYTAYYQPQLQGEYKAVLHNNIGTPQTDVLRFNVYDDSLECRNVDADRELLDLIAKNTGAESIELGDIGTLPQKIQTLEQLSRRRLQPNDIWDRASVFAALVGLLGAEWLMRRILGLV